ncbi:MAG: hypothetical protein IPN18_06965 [Ignavibacteriales bacterium]|nr:hypothetical protein [Ignavibacteriales bacterium]
MKKIVSEAQLIRICAFGGGPGTEILGSLKYFESIAYNGRLDFTLFDRETAWSDSWSDISEKLDSDRIFSTHLFALDFTQPNNFNAKNYLRSDLFFMIYFFSELNLNDNMEKFLFDTLTNAKQGQNLFI